MRVEPDDGTLSFLGYVPEKVPSTYDDPAT